HAMGEACARIYGILTVEQRAFLQHQQTFGYGTFHPGRDPLIDGAVAAMEKRGGGQSLPLPDVPEMVRGRVLANRQPLLAGLIALADSGLSTAQARAAWSGVLVLQHE